MSERRAIVFGERMRERDCRLMAYIGTLGVMASIGRQNILHRPLPVINTTATSLRHLCETLAEDKYDDARARLENADLSEQFRDMGVAIQLLRTYHHPSRGSGTVFDGHARMAFDFMQGISPFYIPDRKIPDVQHVFDFHRRAALDRYASLIEITTDQTESETSVVCKVLRDIEYDIKYV